MVSYPFFDKSHPFIPSFPKSLCFCVCYYVSDSFFFIIDNRSNDLFVFCLIDTFMDCNNLLIFLLVYSFYSRSLQGNNNKTRREMKINLLFAFLSFYEDVSVKETVLLSTASFFFSCSSILFFLNPAQIA